VEFSPEQPLITSVSVNPTNGLVGLVGLGQSNTVYAIEAATNLTAPIFWQRLDSNTADASGVFQFTDTDGIAFPVRFYRVVSP
jgi:hypothetical protein